MKILIPVDGSAHGAAAVAFVASRGTLIGTQPEVELLNVQWPIPPRAARAAGREVVAAFIEAEATAVLRPALAQLKKAGLQARARHLVGSPGATVAAAAAGGGADLVVMGSQGHSAFKGLLFGSVTNAVLAGSTTPLLVVRGARAPVRDSLAVGIALDGSAYGLAAIRHVLKHPHLLGAQPVLHLIHVVPDFSAAAIAGLGDAAAPLPSPQKVRAAQSAAFDRTLAPARRLLAKAGLAGLEICLVGNNAGDEIAVYARKKRLDLLVMGSRGRGLLKSVVMGSVATRVAASCTTPLLLIRRP
jgi:nucleotide-binding universal stress UspA family protein